MTEIEKFTGFSKDYLSRYGIYKIYFINDPKNRVYIGSALNEGNIKNKKVGFQARWTQHLSTLKNNKNKCPKLQHAFNKFGLDNLKFEIIDILKMGYNSKYYDMIETGYISKYNSVKNGLNVSKNGKNRKGIPCPESVKLAISKANSGDKNKMFGKYGEKHPNSKTVYQYNPNGDFLKKWDCARTIQKELGFNYKDISSCCLGKIRVCMGYKWFYIFQGMKIEPFTIQKYKIRGLKSVTKNRKKL